MHLIGNIFSRVKRLACMPQKDLGPALSRVRLRDLLDFFWRPAGDEHMVSFRRETPAERSADAALGTDTDNDRARCAHDFASMRKVQSAPPSVASVRPTPVRHRHPRTIPFP